MAFKLIESAQARWRAVNAPQLVALVRASATFKNGKLDERDDEHPDTPDLSTKDRYATSGNLTQGVRPGRDRSSQ